MRIIESCAACLYNHQLEKTDNAEYLSEIRELLDNRSENDTSPYMLYLFDKTRKKYFLAGEDYNNIKKQYNDLVLAMGDHLREEIERASDPLAKALVISRIGNYIDFAAMASVDHNEFLTLFKETEMRENDIPVYESFLNECEKGKTFLLICDNCGEIVLDKLLIEQLKKRFPHLSFTAMVRGGEVLNDATLDDAVYSGLDTVTKVISNGNAVAGTIYNMLPPDAKAALDETDVILAKGQGNYESMSDQGRHAFYLFLCKCELFTSRFNVPRLTGLFVEED